MTRPITPTEHEAMVAKVAARFTTPDIEAIRRTLLGMSRMSDAADRHRVRRESLENRPTDHRAALDAAAWAGSFEHSQEKAA